MRGSGLLLDTLLLRLHSMKFANSMYFEYLLSLWYEYHSVSANLSHSHDSERMALNKITLKHPASDKFAISVCLQL